MGAMGNSTKPWFGPARRLSTDGYGLVVGKDGVTLGPDFPLVRKTSRGYETATLEELSCLREVVPLGTGDTQRLARHLESIAKALSVGDLARAHILGLYFPINRLTSDQFGRLRKVSALLKENFNPDEPRDERGRWTTGAANTQSSNATSGIRTGAGTGARRQLSIHPDVMRVQEFLPVDPELVDPQLVPKPLIEDEPFPPYDLSSKWPKLTREYCLDAARRSPDNDALWESMCRRLPPRFRRECWAAGEEGVQKKIKVCDKIFPEKWTSNVQY
jgi:hypothetical protein